MTKEENKKYGQRGSESNEWINTKSKVFISNKYARGIILKRNKKIEKLEEIIDRQSKEIIKLKDEIAILQIKENER